jgi:4-hydroxy-tetrahydrodipicolinate reductase
VKLALHGATGRMGQAITRLAHAAGDIQIVGAACAADDPNHGRDVGEIAGVGTLGVTATHDVAAALLGAEVVIDFSFAAAVPGLLALAARDQVAVMSGTTNLDAAGKHALERAAQTTPVLWAPNTSLGVQVLAEVVEHALRRLGPGYDVEIVEIHHRKKADSPSGTAKRLADAAKKARAGLREVMGRDGACGPRQADEIGVFGVRGGDVVGDHTVYLLGPGERIELSHRASSRDLFAHGAIRGARFVHGRPPGLYTMADVLG